MSKHEKAGQFNIFGTNTQPEPVKSDSSEQTTRSSSSPRQTPSMEQIYVEEMKTAIERRKRNEGPQVSFLFCFHCGEGRQRGQTGAACLSCGETAPLSWPTDRALNRQSHMKARYLKRMRQRCRAFKVHNGWSNELVIAPSWEAARVLIKKSERPYLTHESIRPSQLVSMQLPETVLVADLDGKPKSVRLKGMFVVEYNHITPTNKARESILI